MFHPATLLTTFRADPDIRRRAEEGAAPWRELELEDLWQLIFGPRIPRSWMVWSDGDCPACGKPVNMYDWRMEPFAEPWKLHCPHCDERFPKNDFGAFHETGLDESGLFDPRIADRSLLYNTDHAAADDPLRDFGVDDGHGVPAEGGRWRFIGTWLVYGQWKQLIVNGVERLAAAYAATGDVAYARRAGVLLDRIADVYPDFDFGEQAILYEQKAARGYVSTWHDACEEVQRLVLAYDQVRDAIRADREMAAFVQDKARNHRVPSSKGSGDEICAHIEARILRDTLDNIHKIESNFPTTDMAGIVIRAVLGGWEAREEVYGLLDDVVRKATAVDGLSGEKGMAGYAAIAPRTLARYFALFARVDPAFLPRMLARHENLAQLWRFHVDTWVGQRFYPNVGDSGGPGSATTRYPAATFDREGTDPLAPSAFSFFGQLHEATGDAALIQILHHANDGSLEGLPHDAGHPDPEGFCENVRQVIEAHGEQPATGSLNKQQWHLAILRSGDDRRAPTAWLDYDAGAPGSIYSYRIDPGVRGRGAHSHADGMNLGLYYRGVDMMTDRGYPPVNYGGWDNPTAEWYKRTAAHNTIVVDGLEQATAGGQTTWWHDGDRVRGLSVSAPGMVDGGRFERTLVLVSTGPEDAYLVDVHRVQAGTDHARFLHATFGVLTLDGLQLEAAEHYGHHTLLRDTRMDVDPGPAWTADWAVDDVFDLAPDGADLHLRYHDATRDAAAGTCEGFALKGYYGERDERWLPTLMQRRQTRDDGPLVSVFAGVLEPYDGAPAVLAVRRVDDVPDEAIDASVTLEIDLVDGRRDRVVVGVGDAVQIRRDGDLLT